jgi:hypothetical protein
MNLDHLDDPLGPRFLRALQGAPELISSPQSSEFFSLLIVHLSRNLQPSTRKAIYLCLCKVLSKRPFWKFFVARDLLLSLPLSTPSHFELILDICYVLVDRDPDAFTPEFATHFSQIIRYHGRKSLILLTLYSRHFNNLTSPWPMIDLLFREQRRFLAPDIVCEYASLLSLLCQSFPVFRAARASNCWSILSNLLVSDAYDDILPTCYNSLCGIQSVDHLHHIDYSLLQKHFSQESNRSSILSLLILAPFQDEAVDFAFERSFIFGIVEEAATNPRATLVLLKLAQRKTVSQTLASDPNWLSNGLPGVPDTLRIFLVVHSHSEFKSELIGSPAFLQLLKNLNELPQPAVTGVLAGLLRNLRLDKSILVKLSEAGFFKQFLKRRKAVYPFLVMADAISRVCYVQDLIWFVPVVREALETAERDFDSAARACINMVRYPEVKRHVQMSGIPEIVADREKTQECAAMAAKLLRHLRD